MMLVKWNSLADIDVLSEDSKAPGTRKKATFKHFCKTNKKLPQFTSFKSQITDIFDKCKQNKKYNDKNYKRFPSIYF